MGGRRMSCRHRRKEVDRRNNVCMYRERGQVPATNAVQFQQYIDLVLFIFDVTNTMYPLERPYLSRTYVYKCKHVERININ